MKKAYQQPATQVYGSQPENIIALSIMDGKASSSTDVLVKGNGWSLTEGNDEGSGGSIFE